MKLNELIGQEKNKAIEILKKLGYNKIKVEINSKHNELCDTFLVCKVIKHADEVTLICGEFYLNIKE